MTLVLLLIYAFKSKAKTLIVWLLRVNNCCFSHKMNIFDQAAVPRGRWQLHGERAQQVRREGKPCSTLHEGKAVI
jgi:hypothetical protein